MTVNFQSGQIRYSLLVTGRSRREIEAEVDIKPDKTLWAKKTGQKHLSDPDKPVKAHKERFHYRKPRPEEFAEGPDVV